VPTSLDPALARELSVKAFHHAVSKSGVVEAALREFFSRPDAAVKKALDKHGIGKRRRA
jgi:hypothetical protein